jgi:Clp amino terminal domain, pathogenicity island component
MLRAMTPRTKKTAAALSGALVLASGAYALGTQTGDGTALAGDKITSTAGAPGPGRPGGPGPRDLSDIAAKLGVTEAKLRAALEDLRPDRGANKDEHEAALAKALATELGLDEAKVTTALDKFHGDHKVVRRERRGDRLQRFDDALAAKLGVDAAKVRAAFDALKPGPNRRVDKPALADLAKQIGVSEDKLRAAIADLRPGPGRPGGPGFGHDRRGGPGPGFGHDRRGGPGGPAPVAGLAKELGVTQAKLRAALQKIRGDLDKQHEAERDAFVTKLAAKLGVSEAKVKDVIGSRPHHGRRGP